MGISKQITIGEDQLQLQPFSGYKAFKVLRLAKEILKQQPEIQQHIAAYVRQYEQENVVEFERTAALQRFGEDLAHLTDQDWQASGNKLRMPTSPTREEIGLATFPFVLEVAEQQAIRLLALISLTNRELEDTHMEGGEDAVDKQIEEEARRLLHRARIEQLLELAITGYELVEDQLEGTLREAGDRLGNLFRLLGWGPTNQEPAPAPTEESRPDTAASAPRASSSTSSPPATAGPSDESSTAPIGAGSPSSGG